MTSAPSSIALVERRQYDDRKAHRITDTIWWAGVVDPENNRSQNTWLILDNNEAILINPGSRDDKTHRQIKQKTASIIELSRLTHMVVLHNHPDCCAAIPLFEHAADRNVRIYAPSAEQSAIKSYGCKAPVIGLDSGDSIILSSGRTLDFATTPELPDQASGLLFDSATATLFCGNLFSFAEGPWNLFATAGGWDTLNGRANNVSGSRKAFLHALNKIERLSPERICPQQGSIIEEDIDRYIESARSFQQK